MAEGELVELNRVLALREQELDEHEIELAALREELESTVWLYRCPITFPTLDPVPHPPPPRGPWQVRIGSCTLLVHVGSFPCAMRCERTVPYECERHYLKSS